MTLTMGVAAVAVHYFLIPSGLIVGSVSGLSIVIHRLTGIPVSYITFTINGFLLILAYLLIGKEFGTKTVYTALVLSPWLLLFEKIDAKYNIDPTALFPFTDGHVDYWFYLASFVVVLSLSQAVLFRINASTGGLDILAKIVNKFAHIDIGLSVTVSGAIICCTAFFQPDSSLYLVIIGLMGTWVNGLVLNYFYSTLNTRKRICIISPEYRKITDHITQELHRGASLYELRGGATGEPRTEVVSILTIEEYDDLINWLEQQKITCFITAGDVHEVYGQWNRKSRKKKVFGK